MNMEYHDKMVEQVRRHIDTADNLSDMVIGVLKQWFKSPKYEIFRFNPICWRVKESGSSEHILAVVLEDLGEGNYTFIVGGDWPYRPTTRDISRESLIETLESVCP